MPSKSKKQWLEDTLHPAVEKYPERQKEFHTDSGIKIDPLYGPEDLADQGLDYHRDLGYPGEFPYTRGVQPNTYRGRIWTMRQYSGYATAADTNRRYRYLLEQGQTGLSVAFDLPTQIGYDSDHQVAIREVGKVGVPISSLEDMQVLFEGIPLDQVSTSMTINSTASILLCLYIAAAKGQGITPDKLNGTIQNDILKEYIARGTYAYPPRPSIRLVVDVFKYCADQVPRWNTISVSGYHMREAGATAVQELAFTFSNAIAYLQEAIGAGLDLDEFAPCNRVSGRTAPRRHSCRRCRPTVNPCAVSPLRRRRAHLRQPAARFPAAAAATRVRGAGGKRRRVPLPVGWFRRNDPRPGREAADELDPFKHARLPDHPSRRVPD